MRLGGVLRAAAEVLAQTEASGKPAAECLRDWGAAHRFAGAKDRALIGTLCYDALRRRASLRYKIGSGDAQDLIYAALLINADYSAEALEQELSADKFAPPPLGAAQKQAWQSRAVAAAADFIQADIPQWCAPSFAKSFGSAWVAEGQALRGRPPLDMRVNRLKAAPAAVEAELSAYAAEPFPLLPFALRIPAAQGLAAAKRPNLPAMPLFRQGLAEIQDCGSQLAAKLCEARPHEQILDYCAGGGGKTLALAAEMENSGQIYAYDSEPRRLKPAAERLARAGARNVQLAGAPAKIEALKGRMDCVVLDAPCSGAGTWRRSPEAKWRLTEAELNRRLAQQRAVLAAGAAYLRPGGRLVYITCSLLHEENDAQIERFLAAEPRFARRDMRALWERCVPAAAPGSEVAAGGFPPRLLPHFTPFGLLLSPRATQTDGFFISVLEKAAG